MGYSLAWVAVKTKDHESLFELTKVAPTDEKDEYYETPISGAELKNGWFLLVGQGCDHRLISDNQLAVLSARWECLSCAIEEHVMFSSASLWKQGSEVWSVSHDAQKGISNVESSGDTPKSFSSLREKMLECQEAEGGDSADVDFVFDVPLLLAKELTGFKHDEESDCLAQPSILAFEDLSKRRSHKSKPWWKLW